MWRKSTCLGLQVCAMSKRSPDFVFGFEQDGFDGVSVEELVSSDEMFECDEPRRTSPDYSDPHDGERMKTQAGLGTSRRRSDSLGVV